jgi:hypothetical protein
MASPFQKYQSEQVQQINILPYTQAMADQTQKAMAGLGANIGESIKKYQQSKEEREQMAQVAGGVIGEYMETVMDAESQDDVTRLKETAPAHIKDLYKKAEKQGNGDWVAGLGGLANTDFKAWATLQTKYESDEKIRYQKQTDAEKLKIDQYNADTARKNAEANLRQIKIAEANQRQKEAEVEEAKRNASLIRDIQNVDTPASQTIVDIKSRVEPTGDLFDINGEVIASNVEVRDLEADLGVKIVPETDVPKLLKEQEAFPAIATGRWLAGSDKFDVNADFSTARKQDPMATDSFIRRTFKQASMVDPSLKDNKGVTRFFQRGSFDSPLIDDEALKTSAYQLAQKLATSPDMQSWAKTNKVPLVPPNAMVRRAYVKVTGQDVREERTLRQVDIHPEQQERNRFESFRASYERGGKQKLPWSWEMYRALNSQRFFPRTYAPDGTPLLTIGNKVIPESQVGTFGSEGPPAGREAPLEEVQANNWLGQFNKPVKVGNEVWQFNGGVRQWKGNFNLSFKTLETGMQDMLRINDIADKMITMQKTANGFTKVLSPSWQKDYDNLNRQAQTYRRYFIATGQETEPDNARLADILADRELFDALDPERKIRVIEAFKEIVASKVRGTFQSGGGIVKSAPTTKTDIKALANEAGGRTFEELQKKYGEPKK